MTTSVVVGCILLAGDELLRVEQLSVGACTHLICGISFSGQFKWKSFKMLQFVFVQFTTRDTATKLNSINKNLWHTPLQFWGQYLLLHKSIWRYCFWTYKAVWGKSRQHLMNGDRYIYLGCSKFLGSLFNLAWLTYGFSCHAWLGWLALPKWVMDWLNPNLRKSIAKVTPITKPQLPCVSSCKNKGEGKRNKEKMGRHSLEAQEGYLWEEEKRNLTLKVPH